MADFVDVNPAGLSVPPVRRDGPRSTRDAGVDADLWEVHEKGVPEEGGTVDVGTMADVGLEKSYSKSDLRLPEDGKLMRAMERMIFELEDASWPAAFAGFVAPETVSSSDAGSEARSVLCSQLWFRQGDEDGEDGGRAALVGCTGVSWSCTGARVFGCFGVASATGWDATRSGLGVWRVGGEVGGPESVLEWPNSLLCCAAHPAKAGVVACGSAAGEVVVWDVLSEEDVCLGSSPLGPASHRQPVSGVCWLSRGRETFLLSASADGSVRVWRAENLDAPIGGIRLERKGSRRPLDAGMALEAGAGGEDVFVGGGAGLAHRIAVDSLLPKIGMSDVENLLAMCKDNIDQVRSVADRFVSDSSTRRLSPHHIFAALDHIDPIALPFPPAISLSLRAHYGPITALAAHPTERHLLATAGSDGRLRVLSDLAPQGVLDLAPAPPGRALSAVAWAPARPMLLATADDCGTVYIFDLLQDRTKSALLLEPLPHTHSPQTLELDNALKPNTNALNPHRPLTPIHSLQFSPNNRRFLAIAAQDGTTAVVALPFQLSEPRVAEQSAAHTFARPKT